MRDQLPPSDVMLKRRMRQGYQLLLFFVIPAVGSIAPLLVIPAITAQFGKSGWAAIAIATSVGAAGGVIAELGWGVVGPQRIARDPQGARGVYEVSFASKLVACVFIAPSAAVITSLISPSHQLAAVLVAIGSVLSVLSPSWFFVGQGKPFLVLIADTLPKVAASVLAAILISQGWPIETYGVGLLISTVVGCAIAAAIGAVVWWPSRAAFKGSFGVARNQLLVIIGRCISTLYTSLPTALLGSVAPGAVAVFSAADKPMRMGLTVLTGVPNRLQSWVGSPDRAVSRARSNVSIWINVALGVIAGVVYTALAPTVVHFLFSKTIELSYGLAALEGILAALICASRGLGLALVAEERANSITLAIIGAAIVGTLGLVAFGLSFGVGGAILALILAEAVGLAIQAIALCSARKARQIVTA